MLDARETTMKMLSVRLDDEESAALQAICAQTGMTKTEVVKVGIMTLAKGQIKRKSAYELAEQLGLVGGFEGPEDLAENAGKYAKERIREKHRPH
jgi:predicted DNA-binding protein